MQYDRYDSVSHNRAHRLDELAGTVRRKRRRGISRAWIGLFVVVATIIVLICVLAPSYFERDTVTTKVISKENVCNGSGDSVSCDYLVFTEAGTFKISDAIFGTTRFNSSDVYGRIVEGQTYTITSYGWRLPFFSEYPNIEKIEAAS